MFLRSIALVALVIASPQTAREPELGKPFEVRAAEVVTIQGLRISFDSVTEDSRCPTGAQCVWAGDAAATFGIEKPPAAAVQRALHTNGRFEQQTDYDNFVIRLEDVRPYPKEGVAIAPADYRATLVVTRRDAAQRDRISGVWTSDSRPLLELEAERGAVSGTVHFYEGSSRRASAPIDSGSFDDRAGVLRVAGRVTTPEGRTLSYVVEGVLQQDALRVTLTVDDVNRGSQVLRRLDEPRAK